MNRIDASVGFRTRTFRSSLIRPNNTDTYTAGDVISAVTTDAHFTFGAAADDNSKRVGRADVMTGTINSIRLHSSANQATKLQGELWLFSTDITNVADNAAFAPSDAEMLTLVAVIPIPQSAWYVGKADSGADGNAVCCIDNIDIPARTGNSGRLYGQLVARNAYVPIASQSFTCDLIWTDD